MSKLPALKPAEVIRALVNKAGFFVQRISGSHYILKHPDGRRVTVPFYGRDLAPGTVKSIIRRAGLSREEFLKLL
jgi:predicted RNA binding protein YcfA (HicA-like mRNA interferase family)